MMIEWLEKQLKDLDQKISAELDGHREFALRREYRELERLLIQHRMQVAERRREGKQ